MKRVFLLIIFFILSLIAAAAAVNARYPVKYFSIIKENTGRLEPALVCAVIRAESSFRPLAESRKGAAGLMQITEATGIWMAGEMGMEQYEPEYVWEPEINIAIGCYFLNWLMDYYSDNLELALCAYNAGMGNVNRWLADPDYSMDGENLNKIPFPETETYLRRVAKNQKIYRIILSLRGRL